MLAGVANGAGVAAGGGHGSIVRMTGGGERARSPAALAPARGVLGLRVPHSFALQLVWRKLVNKPVYGSLCRGRLTVWPGSGHGACVRLVLFHVQTCSMCVFSSIYV